MPIMKKVELIRERIVRGQSSELLRLRSFISMADNSNLEAIAALDPEPMRELVAEITELVMARLGHVNVVLVDDPKERSKARRAVAKTLGVPKGE